MKRIPFKTYNLFVITFTTFIISIALILGFVLQPLNGNLTRIGGYSENNYGWNKPQAHLENQLYTTADSETYAKYYDVVVIGDSFSNYSEGQASPPKAYWPNFFVNTTGLTLITYHMDTIDLNKLIESKTFKEYPPRFLIYETAERNLIFRTSPMKGDCQYKKPPPKTPVKTHRLNSKTVQFERSTKTGLKEINLDVTIHFMKNFVLRLLTPMDNLFKVVKVTLDQDNLFSNRENKTTLIWYGDFIKYNINEEMVRKGVCGLLNLQNKVQNNNKITFIAMIAPDKLSVYSKYLKNSPSKKGNELLEFISRKKINFPRVDISLKREIKNNFLDIYLPNDSHWSPKGHEIVAQTLVDYLENQGEIQKSLPDKIAKPSSENKENLSSISKMGLL